MKSFLFVTVFFLTILNSGNASEDEAEDFEALLNRPLVLKGYNAPEYEEASAEKFTLAQNLNDQNDEAERNTVEALEDARNEWVEQIEVSSVESYKARLIAQGQQKQASLDYFRLDSEESDPKELLNNINKDSKEFSAETSQFLKEIKRGDMTMLTATNKHFLQPHLYPDFARRFVLQYPYKEIINGAAVEEEDSSIKPKQARPELVLQVAKESAILDAVTPDNPSDDVIYKDILRSGNYWNSFWKEDVDPKLLRTEPKKLQSFKAKVLPDSDIYVLVGKLKQVSPKLLYVMNKRSRD